jgi:hypothetical protein
MLGAYAGNRLGAVRDAKGKSVAAVFSELGGNQKAEVSQLYDILLYNAISLLDTTCTSHESFRLCYVVTKLSLTLLYYFPPTSFYFSVYILGCLEPFYH